MIHFHLIQYYLTPSLQPKSPIIKKKKGVRIIGQDSTIKSHPRQKVKAQCNAESYNFKLALPLINKYYTLLPHIADDVYHIKLQSPSFNLNQLSNAIGEAYVFSDGTCVVWGGSCEENINLSSVLKESEVNPYMDKETDEYDYYNDDQQ